VSGVMGCALCLSTASVRGLFPSENLFSPVTDAVYPKALS
jgi:hypothetical protein